MANVDVNKVIDLAQSIVSVGVASVKLTFTTKQVDIAFAFQGIKVEIEIEYAAIDMAVESIKTQIAKLVNNKK